MFLAFHRNAPVLVGLEDDFVAQLLLTFIAALVALAYASMAVVWPHRIQKWWVANRLRRNVAMKIYGRFVQSPNYILRLRITGMAAVVVSVLLFSSAFKLLWSLMR